MDHRRWPDVLREPREDVHIVQLYRDETFLQKAVGSWAAHGLGAGGSVVLVGAPDHLKLVLDHLQGEGYDAAQLRRVGVLQVFDAEGLLQRFMGEKGPDPDAFRRAVEPVLAKARVASRGGEVRVWGEMVDLLAKAGRTEDARALEALWEQEIARAGFRLLCSYGADNLDPATHAGALHEATSSHDRLLAEEDEPSFDLAVARALVQAVPEPEAEDIWKRYSGGEGIGRRMSPAEAVVVGLLRDNPKLGLRVLQEARRTLVATRPPRR